MLRLFENFFIFRNFVIAGSLNLWICESVSLWLSVSQVVCWSFTDFYFRCLLALLSLRSWCQWLPLKPLSKRRWGAKRQLPSCNLATLFRKCLWGLVQYFILYSVFLFFFFLVVNWTRILVLFIFLGMGIQHSVCIPMHLTHSQLW